MWKIFYVRREGNLNLNGEKSRERERRERDNVFLFGQEEGKMSFLVRFFMILKILIIGKIVLN